MSEETKFETLPLAITVKGEVVASNFSEFREAVETRLKAINRTLETDEQFGQAEQDVKAMKAAEKSIADAKAEALKQAEEMNALFAEMDSVSEEIRKVRLELDKMVTAKKVEVKESLIKDAYKAIELDDSVKALKQTELFKATRNKRSIKAMKKALDSVVSVINAGVDQTRLVLDQFEKKHGKTMTMDRRELEAKDYKNVEVELQRRLDLKRAEEERQILEEKARKAEEEKKAANEALKASEAKNKGVPLPPKSMPIPQPAKAHPTLEDGETTEPEDETKTAAYEMGRFIGVTRTAFKALGEAKSTLQHDENIKKVTRFQKAVNVAWKELIA